MKPTTNFLEQCEVLGAARRHAHMAEIRFMRAAPTMFKEVREELALTQAELGAILGVTASYICKIETGRTIPSTNTLVNLAVFLEELEWTSEGEQHERQMGEAMEGAIPVGSRQDVHCSD